MGLCEDDDDCIILEYEKYHRATGRTKEEIDWFYDRYSRAFLLSLLDSYFSVKDGGLTAGTVTIVIGRRSFLEEWAEFERVVEIDLCLKTRKPHKNDHKIPGSEYWVLDYEEEITKTIGTDYNDLLGDL